MACADARTGSYKSHLALRARAHYNNGKGREAEKEKDSEETRMATQFTAKDCLELCENCYRVCLQTVIHALQPHDRPFHESHLRLLMDCANICRTCADFLLSGSDFHDCGCRACARICEHCAEFCGERRDDAQMRAGEQACLRCNESCAQLAA